MLKRVESPERESPVSALRNFISDGGYVPGDRLPAERELIVSLDVSRATLRKALDVLERDGTIWRHVAIAREAAIKASRESILMINTAKERARQASNWADYEAEDDHLHRAIVECTDNPLLIGMFDQLNQVRRAVALGNVVRGSERPPENHSSFTEHERITVAIESRDPSGAEAAMRQHIASVSARLFGED